MNPRVFSDIDPATLRLPPHESIGLTPESTNAKSLDMSDLWRACHPCRVPRAAD